MNALHTRRTGKLLRGVYAQVRRDRLSIERLGPEPG
jgi:hypothetical protein